MRKLLLRVTVWWSSSVLSLQASVEWEPMVKLPALSCLKLWVLQSAVLKVQLVLQPSLPKSKPGML